MDLLDEAIGAHAGAQQLVPVTREALQAAIRNVLRDGEKQIDLVHKTRYTRKYIRRIANETPAAAGPGG